MPSKYAKRYPESHWREVARVIERCQDGRTGHAVMHAFGVNINTAHAWVKRCRQYGLIGPREPTCSGRCGKCCPQGPNDRKIETEALRAEMATARAALVRAYALLGREGAHRA